MTYTAEEWAAIKTAAVTDSQATVHILARTARQDLRTARGAFRALARRNGYEGRAGGWIYHNDRAVTQGWQALASLVATGRVRMLHDDAVSVDEPADQTAHVDRHGDTWVRFDGLTDRGNWHPLTDGPGWEPRARGGLGSARAWLDVIDYLPLTPADDDRADLALRRVEWEYRPPCTADQFAAGHRYEHDAETAAAPGWPEGYELCCRSATDPIHVGDEWTEPTWLDREPTSAAVERTAAEVAEGSRVEHTGYPEAHRPVWVVDRVERHLAVPGERIAHCHQESDPRVKARYWVSMLTTAAH